MAKGFLPAKGFSVMPQRGLFLMQIWQDREKPLGLKRLHRVGIQ